MKSKDSLVKETVRNILEYINDNNLTPGMKLPNETILATEFGVSRNTLREAVKILTSYKTVEIKRGVGTFITHSDSLSEKLMHPIGFFIEESEIKKMIDLFEIRMILEPHAISHAIDNLNDQSLQELVELNERMIDKILTDKEDHFIEDIKFHNRIAELSNNIAMIQILPIIIDSIQFYNINNYSDYETKISTIEFHRKIIKNLIDRDKKGAYENMYNHLKVNFDQLTKLKSELKE